MNRDDIIRMAREAGLPAFLYPELIAARDWKLIERFAALVAAAERERISDEWWMCVQSDLENGVKSLNDAATEKWKKEYPEISKFGGWLAAKGTIMIPAKQFEGELWIKASDLHTEVKRAIEAEREACAKDLDELSEAAKDLYAKGFVWQAINKSAAVIRARKQA